MSDVTVVKRRRSKKLALTDAAGGALAIREQIFALAKFNLQEQTALFERSLVAVNDGLVAMKDEHYVVPGARGEGATLERVTGVDTTARLRAASMAWDLLGVEPSKSAGANSAPGQVVNVIVAQRDMSHPASVVPIEPPLDGTVIASAPAAQQ
jgi:hypothetical protein